MLQYKNDEDLFPADSTDFVHNDFVAAWKVRNLWNVFIFLLVSLSLSLSLSAKSQFVLKLYALRETWCYSELKYLVSIILVD